jgi:hypothetical protein
LGTGLAEGSKPYLTGATLYISVDDWADIWLNGIPIVDGQRRTGDDKSFQTIHCLPEHLCYFHRDNLLAILNSNAYRDPQSGDDQVGLAYSLHLRFSDGTQTVLTSNDPDEDRAFYREDREETEPRGWHNPSFDDTGWASAGLEGPKVPGLAELTDPETGIAIAFLTTRPGLRPKPGERHFYRRRFSLDIGPSPYCPPSSRSGFWDQNPKMIPTTTPAPLASTKVAAASTPMTEKRGTKPVSDIYQPLRDFLDLPTFTPTPGSVPAHAVGNGAEVIVFDRPPANIYITFADGPGLYTVDVLDPNGVLVKRILEKKVVAEHGEWAVWDGKDPAGADSLAGDYQVLLSKEGKPISRTLVRKISTP